MFCFILRLKLTSASSGMASFSSFVQSRLDGKLARSFTINSDSRFRAPCGLLGFPLRNTLMIGTLDSFLFLHCWLAGPSPSSRLYHVLSAHGDWIFHRFEKLQLVSSTWTRFLGFICDSVRQVFLIPEYKKVKFTALREDVILSPFVALKTLQHFSGKVTSFSFSIPRCRLYVRDIFKAISRLSGSTRSPIKVEAALRAEIEY